MDLPPKTLSAWLSPNPAGGVADFTTQHINYGYWLLTKICSDGRHIGFGAATTVLCLKKGGGVRIKILNRLVLREKGTT